MTNYTKKFLELIEFLRVDPNGCPWTKEQTHKSLSHYLIEESYEIADTIEQGNTGAELQDELGDMLLQLALHTQIASEDKRFTFNDIAKSIYDKVVRRTPSVFDDKKQTLKTAEEIEDQWDQVKELEKADKGDESVLDGVPKGLPALVRAQKIKNRAVRVGWEWDNVENLIDKIAEEVTEIKHEINRKTIDKDKAQEEIGDLLFIISDFARWYDIDAEEALRITTRKFEKRFHYIEKRMKEMSKDITKTKYAEQYKLWVEAKELEKKT